MQSEELIQICQPGFDVRNCPDWAYLFNGAWPNLSIVWEKTVAVTSSSQSIPHNLGFPALAMAWYTQNGVSWGRVAGSEIEVDNNNFYLNLTSVTTGSCTIRLYNVDISKEATYPLPQSAQAKLPYNNQFGAKVAKSGKAITSNNLNDFILHTRAQSPAVLDVATEKGKYMKFSQARHYWPYGNIPPSPGWQLIVYPLQTSFVPWYTGGISFGFNQYELASGSSIYYDSVSNSLVLNITSSGQGSLVVLRDPLFYPNVVQAVY